jgi:hypothetical protein
MMQVLELANQLTFFMDPDAKKHFSDVKDLTLEIVNGPKNEEHNQEVCFIISLFLFLFSFSCYAFGKCEPPI